MFNMTQSYDISEHLHDAITGSSVAGNDLQGRAHADTQPTSPLVFGPSSPSRAPPPRRGRTSPFARLFLVPLRKSRLPGRTSAAPLRPIVRQPPAVTSRSSPSSPSPSLPSLLLSMLSLSVLLSMLLLASIPLAGRRRCVSTQNYLGKVYPPSLAKGPALIYGSGGRRARARARRGCISLGERALEYRGAQGEKRGCSGAAGRGGAVAARG
jgi:hypothetical protein